MRHELIADEGKWLYREPQDPEQKRDFCHKALTSEPEEYLECTDEEKIAYEAKWDEEHPVEEPLNEEQSEEIQSV